MARRLAALYEVEAVLTAAVPIHIGNNDEELVQDAPVARDGSGHPYLPGTSLAGPIRAWWGEKFGDAWTGSAPFAAGAMFGPVLGRGGPADTHASLIAVEDAPAKLPGGLGLEIRDGVGIDRVTGAAAARIKYDRQVLPAGTTFGLRLRFEVPAKEEEKKKDEPKLPRPSDAEAKTMLTELLLALEAGHIRFGAAKTRGLGRLVASDVQVYRHDTESADGVLARLRRTDRTNLWPGMAAGRKAALGSGRAVLLVHWKPVTSVSSQSGQQGVTIDALPLVAGRHERGEAVGSRPAAGRDELVPVVTGASLKGVLRSHAERIVRTLIYSEAELAAMAERSRSHQDQIAVPLVELLFGAPGRSRATTAGESGGKKAPPSRLGLGALAVDDCLFGDPVTPDDWRRIVDATDAKPEFAVKAAQTAVDGTGWRGARLAQMVAIDRWTGAAADALLFNRLEPKPGVGGVFRLTLDLDRVVDDVAKSADEKDMLRGAAVVLLLFALRDLVEGTIPIGFGGNRGLGTIAVEGIEVAEAGTGAAALGFAPGGLNLKKADRAGLTAFSTADGHWRAWLAQQRGRDAA